MQKLFKVFKGLLLSLLLPLFKTGSYISHSFLENPNLSNFVLPWGLNNYNIWNDIIYCTQRKNVIMTLDNDAIIWVFMNKAFWSPKYGLLLVLKSYCSPDFIRIFIILLSFFTPESTWNWINSSQTIKQCLDFGLSPTVSMLSQYQVCGTVKFSKYCGSKYFLPSLQNLSEVDCEMAHTWKLLKERYNSVPNLHLNSDRYQIYIAIHK